MVGSDSATEAIVPYVVVETGVAVCNLKGAREMVRCCEDSTESSGRITTGEHVRADAGNEWQLGVDVKCDVNTRATVLYCTAVQ